MNARCRSCRRPAKVKRGLCAKCAPKLHEPVRMPAGVPIL